jgi:carboxymethylenebutenolidase
VFVYRDTERVEEPLADVRCNGKVAVLGYCLGALMVFLTAARCHGVDAAVAYHGGDTEKYLGEVSGLVRRQRATHLR